MPVQLLIHICITVITDLEEGSPHITSRGTTSRHAGRPICIGLVTYTFWYTAALVLQLTVFVGSSGLSR